MKLANLITACLFIAAFASCKGGSTTKETNDISTVDSITPTGINALYEYGDSGKHTAGNASYTYKFQFKNDKSLPVVVNPMGYQYYDNKAVLTLKRGGQTVLSKSFTKADFKSLIPENVYNNYALIGFCYNIDKEDAKDAVYFIATVGDPDTSADTSYVIEIRINAAGDFSYSILQDKETLPVANGMTIDPEADND